MFCPHCHNKIPDGSNFCPLCYANLVGVKQQEKESAAETERRRASLDGALDELRRRYGGAAVRRGRLFARDEAERARTESGVPDVPVRDRED